MSKIEKALSGLVHAAADQTAYCDGSFEKTVGLAKDALLELQFLNLCDRCCKVAEQLTDFTSRALAKMQNKNPFVKGRP